MTELIEKTAMERCADIPEGDAVAVTASAGTTADLYGYENDITVVPKESSILSGRKKYVRYYSVNTSMYKEFISIFMPTRSAYIRYDVVHNEIADINSDVWRIEKAYLCDNRLQNPVAITEVGEWELAVRLKDRPDFSGGRMHGDEILDTIIFYVNGVETDVTTLTDMTEFESFSFIQTSHLYDPNDNITLIAEHGSEHIFDGKLTINQSLLWKVAEQLENCYMAMFPISKKYSDKYYTDANFTITELTGKLQTVPNAKTVNIFSAAHGLQSIFAITEYPSRFGSGAFLTTDNTPDQTGLYNKCYYVITSGKDSESSEVDELWKTQTIYDIRY